MQSEIKNLMQKFDFNGQSGFLQYWELKHVRNEWVLTVAVQPFLSTNDDEGLENYRKRSLKQRFSVGPGQLVDKEWFSCVAVQTRVADQRTSHNSNQFMGQLVVPIFVNMGAHQILLGVIELVTAHPKACYIEDFNQIYNLLKNENLETNPMVTSTLA
ncbi:hypothetical protein HanPSC8_Chr17g0751971 [Helianthus annuus]|nr:hypothetical protein HanPSC8_Chr17g0751971 [Helianthus annuus]